MRYRYYEINSTKKTLTYFLYVIVVLWFFATVALGYQFLVKNSKSTSKKWWTFVEAIFDQVSYLPYLKNDWQSMFYQSFLFDACVGYATLNSEGLKGETCKITTQDYQTYYVNLATGGKVWSDGTPMTLDDVYFTYDHIIRQNAWDIKTLKTYQEIQISQENDKLKIVFPTSTTDNNYFFSFYILPKHVLEHANSDMYKKIFAANPVTSGCGKIAPKSSDSQSLVFDLTKCEDTNLAFYQIKNYNGFDTLAKSVLEGKNTLVDTYANQVTLEGYQKLNIIKSQILTLFFNTKSERMKVRLRRALWWLINANFYTGEYKQYLKKYNDPLLTLFYSDGSNIKEFINRLSASDEWEEAVQQKDLQDSGVQPLKKSISINGVERKFLFYLQKPEKTFNLDIKFSNQFEVIKVKDASGNTFSPKNYKKTDKKITYPLELGKNLKDGLNQYTIEWTIKGKTYTIANIDLYLLTTTAPKIEQNTDVSKISVVYYNNLESNFAIKQLRELLTRAGILEYFLFEQVSSPEELEAKLVMGNYDILLNTINIGLKKDILKILTTSDALVNPSKYTNPKLTNLFKQYTKSPQKTELSTEISKIFAQDMPFVVLWYPFDFVNVKSNLLENGFAYTGDLYEYNWRNYLYHTATLVQNTVLDFSKLKDVSGFIKHIQQLTNPNLSWNLKTEPVVSGSGENLSGALQTITETWNQNSSLETSDQRPQINTDNPFEGLVKPA